MNFELLRRLRQILNQNSAISDFVKALSCVRVPEGYFYYYVKKLTKSFRRNNISQIDAIKKQIFSCDVQYRGKLFTENKWWEKLRKLLCKFK